MLNVITTICFVLMILMFVWILKASHNICGAIQAILDIQHSRDKIENLACKRIMELQADKGKLIDENRQAKKILRAICEGYSSTEVSEIEIIERIQEAEAFLKE